MAVTGVVVIHESNFTAELELEVKVRRDGKFVWINLDGKCIARVKLNRYAMLAIADHRKDLEFTSLGE